MDQTDKLEAISWLRIRQNATGGPALSISTAARALETILEKVAPTEALIACRLLGTGNIGYGSRPEAIAEAATELLESARQTVDAAPERYMADKVSEAQAVRRSELEEDRRTRLAEATRKAEQAAQAVVDKATAGEEARLEKAMAAVEREVMNGQA